MNARLHNLKLRTLVREHRSPDSEIGEPTSIGVGAAVLVGDEAWVLLEDHVNRGLGIGLAWMQRAGARSLNLLAGEEAGSLARRARHFFLDIDVWHVQDRQLVAPVVEELPPEPEPKGSHLEFRSMILDGGAEVVIEHGIVRGEVCGLEVCRVVDDPENHRARLEVGVGVHDREAFALMHGETPTFDSLKRIVDVVRRHRAPGANPHPLNRLGAERALRSRAIDDPMSIGARQLRAVSLARPRANVKDAVPCAAIGETIDGEQLVAVFSTGIDLDVVPTSADTRFWHGLFDARLVIVVPERDASPVTQRLAAALHRPATVVAAPTSLIS